MSPSERAKSDLDGNPQPSKADHCSIDCGCSVKTDAKRNIAIPMTTLSKGGAVRSSHLLPVELPAPAQPKRECQKQSGKEDPEPAGLPDPILSGTDESTDALESRFNRSLSLSVEETEGCDLRDGKDNPTSPPSSHSSIDEKPVANWKENFKIQPSKLGGLGAFAVRELKRGETILVEAPLLRTTHFRLMPDYHDLSDAAKKVYLGLHGADDGDAFSRVERIKTRNSFSVPGGIAIFEIASRFNHACPPARNVQYWFDSQRGVLSLTICRDVVPAGTELLLNYGGSPADLYSTYGFRCACGGCTPLTDEDIKRLRDQEYGIFRDW